MLITFADDGSVEFTRNADLLGLFPDDRKSITRMSLIEFDEARQLHYIEMLKGPGLHHTVGHGPLGWEFYDHAQTFVDDHSPALCAELIVDTRDTNQWFFRTYEDAVAIEIAFIDFLRTKGYSFQ